MKKTKLLIFSLLSLMLVGCAGNGDEPVVKEQKVETLASRYAELSTKPVVSALDIALGKVSPTKAEDCIIGLTDEDAEYIMSLDEGELMKIQSQIMNHWGIDSADKVEAISDSAYESVCERLEPEELDRFNNFVDAYIELPDNISTQEFLNSYDFSSLDSETMELYVNAALMIDNVGRKLYKYALDSETRMSGSDCRKYFGVRLTIASINMMAGVSIGWILPGPGWVVAASAILEAAYAGLDYYRCVK